MNLTHRIFSLVAIALLPLIAEAGAVDQLHDFLKSTKTLKADFAQSVIAKNGRKPQQSSGVVAIARPGKLRWEIQKPFPQLVVGDGEKIWIHDPELQQVTVRKAGQAIEALSDMVPQNATVIASSDFCPFVAYHINDQVLCFQGHPEFIHDYSRALLNLRQESLGEQIYSSGISSLEQEHHGRTVAEWMMRFVSHNSQTQV